MTILETPKSLARTGGWRRYTDQDGTRLHPWYRNFALTATAPGDTYVLPPWSSQNGSQILPFGTTIHIHNVGAQSIDVESPSHFTHTILAGKTSSLMLIGGNSNRNGSWLVVQNNATNGVGTSHPTGFRFDDTIWVPQNNYNLLAMAVAAGYDGTVGALCTVLIPAGVVVGSESVAVPSFDFGGDVAVSGINWHASSQFFLRLLGKVDGCGGVGGNGGIGGTGASAGTVGGVGGVAIRAKKSCTITLAGQITGGSGGGGGGNGQLATAGLSGGGGGGGAGATVLEDGSVVGGEGGGSGGTGCQPGRRGSVLLGGDGGSGSQILTDTGGVGGAGGAFAGAGAVGTGVNGVGTVAGGAAGAAISRDTLATVTLAPASSGTVLGATIIV